MRVGVEALDDFQMGEAREVFNMVQIIGLMISAYIVTRCADMALAESTGKIVTILSVLTAIFTIICALALVAQGAASPLPGRF